MRRREKCVLSPFMDEIIENTMVNRFAWMMEWFGKKIGNEACAPRADGPVAVAAWVRFQRLGRRFVALVKQWQAGTLPVVVPAVAPARPRAKAVRVAKPGLLSRGVNWFRKLFPATSIPLSGHLDYLLECEAEIRAIVAATPEAGRILRPMCHMVGLKAPAWLALPRRKRKPRVAKPIPENETPEQAERRVARMSPSGRSST